MKDLEELMVQELENSVPQSDLLKIVKHKQLGGKLPNIDFGLCDLTSNSIMFCELKWFAAADSTKELSQNTSCYVQNLMLISILTGEKNVIVHGWKGR